MFAGYFRFEHEGVMRIGYFNLFDGHQFYSVWLFSSVQRVTDRNDPAYVVEKPQLRYVTEVVLECYRTFAVDFNTARWPVFVVHKSFFEDESIVFRHGMAGIFTIFNKILILDGDLVAVDKGDFPLSTLDQSLSEDDIDPSVFGRPFSFIDEQYDLYHFRNMLAYHFSEALSGGKEKRSFRFEMYCKPLHFLELVMQKQEPSVDIAQPKFRGHSGGSILTHDSIFKVISPTTEASVEFESVDLLFNLLGNFFYFWPLTSSKNYTTGGFKDFEFLSMDRFNSNLLFVYDYRARRLRASGKLGVVRFDAAFGAEGQSQLMIQALSDKLCDDVPFIDEETGVKYVVVSVERNACSDLVVKGKPHMKFNGLVAWALAIDDSKWKKKLNSACRHDPTWGYRECIPMDPSDFDIDRHVIPFIPSVTPMKKRVKRDPDEISPDKSWKPSTKSKRTERGKEVIVATRKFFQHKVDACVSSDVPCQAAVWLFRALHSACDSNCADYRMAMETSLEWASIPDISRAIFFVLGVDIETPVEKCACKTQFLRNSIQHCLALAEAYEYV